MRIIGMLLTVLLSASIACAQPFASVECQSYYPGDPVRCVVIQGQQSSTVGCQQLKTVYGGEGEGFPDIPAIAGPYDDVCVFAADAVEGRVAYCFVEDAVEGLRKGDHCDGFAAHSEEYYSGAPTEAPSETMHTVPTPAHHGGHH